MKYAHRIGAVFFVLWGLLHAVGGGVMARAVAADSGTAMLAMIATAVPQTELSTIGGAADSVFQYHAFNIAWLGALVAVLGVMLNWKNSRVGFWLNLAIVGTVDLGLVVTTILPGYMRPTDAAPGLLLFLLAAIFCTIGQMRGSTPTVVQSA